MMELWRNPPEIVASFHLPSKNEFIPSDFSIRASDTCADDFANSTSPRCIVDEALIKFWYKPDSTFKVPRANTYFRISMKGGYADVKSCVLSELFIHLLKDELNEITYQVNYLFIYNRQQAIKENGKFTYNMKEINKSLKQKTYIYMYIHMHIYITEKKKVQIKKCSHFSQDYSP